MFYARIKVFDLWERKGQTSYRIHVWERANERVVFQSVLNKGMVQFKHSISSNTFKASNMYIYAYLSKKKNVYIHIHTHIGLGWSCTGVRLKLHQSITLYYINILAILPFRFHVLSMLIMYAESHINWTPFTIQSRNSSI